MASRSRAILTLTRALLTLGVLASACGGKSARDATGGDATCPEASITFKLSLAPGSNSTLCIGSLGTCYASNWLTIRSAAGDELSQGGGCPTACGTCRAIGCPLLCILPSPLTTEGTTLTWDGGYAQASTCGGGVACVGSACAAPGDYVAELCAFDETDPTQPSCSMLAATPRCVQVPFHWPPPSTGTVVSATLGDPP